MSIDHVIIMAASPVHGQMEKLTHTRPKAMLPVVGKPLIARVMESYYKVGIRRFTVVVGEAEGSVAVWLSNKWYADAQVTFAPQGHVRGTASTLFATRKMIDGPFIIAPCDTLVSQEHIKNLCQFFETHPHDATVLTLHTSETPPDEAISVVRDPRGRVIYITEHKVSGHQGHSVALPVYGFTPAILDYLDKVPVDEKSGARPLSSAIQMMIDAKLAGGGIEADWMYSVHEPRDLLAINRHFLKDMSTPSLMSDLPTSVEIDPPVHIDPGVTIGERSHIGPGVYLESGTIIGHDVTLEEVVVLSSQISSKQQIRDEILYEDRL